MLVPGVDFSARKARVRELDRCEVEVLVLSKRFCFAVVFLANQVAYPLSLRFCLWIILRSFIQLNTEVVSVLETAKLCETRC